MEEMKKYLAEAVGTMLLVVFGCGVAVATGCTGNDGIVATALAFGLVIVALAYSIGNVSGCHVNPAVSLAMYINKKITLREFLGYVIGQVIGAIVGAAVVGLLFGSFTNLGGNAVQSDVVAAYGEGGGLVIGLAVTGVVIGLSLTLVHLLGIRLTGTSVNPARSLGPALLQMIGGDFTAISQIWIFIVGPLAGAALAAVLYRWLASRKEGEEQA